MVTSLLLKTHRALAGPGLVAHSLGEQADDGTTNLEGAHSFPFDCAQGFGPLGLRQGRNEWEKNLLDILPELRYTHVNYIIKVIMILSSKIMYLTQMPPCP
jgi:hypothetical protein